MERQERGPAEELAYLVLAYLHAEDCMIAYDEFHKSGQHFKGRSGRSYSFLQVSAMHTLHDLFVDYIGCHDFLNNVYPPSLRKKLLRARTLLEKITLVVDQLKSILPDGSLLNISAKCNCKPSQSPLKLNKGVQTCDFAEIIVTPMTQNTDTTKLSDLPGNVTKLKQMKCVLPNVEATNQGQTFKTMTVNPLGKVNNTHEFQIDTILQKPINATDLNSAAETPELQPQPQLPGKSLPLPWPHTNEILQQKQQPLHIDIPQNNISFNQNADASTIKTFTAPQVTQPTNTVSRIEPIVVEDDDVEIIQPPAKPHIQPMKKPIHSANLATVSLTEPVNRGKVTIISQKVILPKSETAKTHVYTSKDILNMPIEFADCTAGPIVGTTNTTSTYVNTVIKTVCTPTASIEEPKSSSTPRRSSHIRVLDFATPQRVEEGSEAMELSEENIRSDNENEIKLVEPPENKENRSEDTVVTTSLQGPVMTAVAKSTSAIVLAAIIDSHKISKGWDADIRSFVPVEDKLKARKKPKPKPKRRINGKKAIQPNNDEIKDNDETKDKNESLKGNKTKKNRKQRRKITKTEAQAALIENAIRTEQEEVKENNTNENTNQMPNVNHDDKAAEVFPHIEKINVSEMLDTPLKTVMMDLPMLTPRLLSSLGEPISDMKITNIPTPDFSLLKNVFNSASRGFTPASYSSRPTDYSSGGSYYKPDEFDYENLLSPVGKRKKSDTLEEGSQNTTSLRTPKQRQCKQKVKNYYGSINSVEEAGKNVPTTQEDEVKDTKELSIGKKRPLAESKNIKKSPQKSVSKTSKSTRSRSTRTKKTPAKFLDRKITKKTPAKKSEAEKTCSKYICKTPKIRNSTTKKTPSKSQAKKIEDTPDQLESSSSSSSSTSSSSSDSDDGRKLVICQDVKNSSRSDISESELHSLIEEKKARVMQKLKNNISEDKKIVKTTTPKSLGSHSVPANRVSLFKKMRTKSIEAPKQVDVTKSVTFKSRRKSATPRKVSKVNQQNSDSEDNMASETVVEKFTKVIVEGIVKKTKEKDVSQISTPSENAAPPPETDVILQIKEYIDNSKHETALSTSLIEKGFDPETAKKIEKDLLDSPRKESDNTPNIIAENERSNINMSDDNYKKISLINEVDVVKLDGGENEVGGNVTSKVIRNENLKTFENNKHVVPFSLNKENNLKINILVKSDKIAEKNLQKSKIDSNIEITENVKTGPKVSDKNSLHCLKSPEEAKNDGICIDRSDKKNKKDLTDKVEKKKTKYEDAKKSKSSTKKQEKTDKKDIKKDSEQFKNKKDRNDKRNENLKEVPKVLKDCNEFQEKFNLFLQKAKSSTVATSSNVKKYEIIITSSDKQNSNNPNPCEPNKITINPVSTEQDSAKNLSIDEMEEVEDVEWGVSECYEGSINFLKFTSECIEAVECTNTKSDFIDKYVFGVNAFSEEMNKDVTLLITSSKEVDLFEMKEDENLEQSVAYAVEANADDMDDVDTPRKTYSQECIDLFDSTLTSIDTPLKDIAESASKRKLSSDAPEPDNKKCKKVDTQLLVDQMDIESVLSKLHGPQNKEYSMI